jgi:hypothetical protein
MEVRVRLAVNGQTVDRAVDVRRSLADFLRDDLALTGTHVGCEHGVWGLHRARRRRERAELSAAGRGCWSSAVWLGLPLT